MMLKKKNIALLLLLIILIILSSLVPVSVHGKGPFHISMQILKGFLIAFSWSVFYYFVKISFFERYKAVYHREIPRIISFLAKMLIFICAALSIVVFVIGQSVLSIFAVGGLLGAGLTFALGELILDAFSGVILETESPFAIHDWIKTLAGEEGRVVKINWRTVILESLDGYLIVIPHRKIAQGFINYSKPERNYWDSIEIALDHTIPVERAERILRAGAMMTPSIHNQQCDVTAKKANESGVTYEVRYLVPDFSIYREVKHDVIDCVTQHLHAYNLRISEVIGEYMISQGARPFKEESPLTIENLIKKVELFKDLPQEAVAQLSHNAVRQLYGEGEQIVREGEEGKSLFLIGEGIVEISIAYKSSTGAKKKKKLFRLNYPESFGEMALLLNDKRSATVTAVMSTVVYEISQDLLKATLKNHPKIFDKLKKQALAKKEKNKLTKDQMEKVKDKKAPPSKGLLASLKKFFK